MGGNEIEESRDKESSSNSFQLDMERANNMNNSRDVESSSNSFEYYDGQEAPNDQLSSIHDVPISRHQSVIERMQTKYSFFHENLKSKRKYLALRFLMIYGIMSFFILGIFSIYWGSSYGRDSRLKNLRMLVVIEDDIEVDGVSPLIGDTVKSLFSTDVAKYYGDWIIFNSTEFQAKADEYSNTIEEEVVREIHHQEYWSSIYIPANATYNLYKSIIEGDSSYNISNNSIISIYETGRDFEAMESYVVPSVQVIEGLWLESQSNVSFQLTQLMQNLSSIFSNEESIMQLTTPISFNYIDRAPLTEPVLIAPSQVGLIYMIIITFFQINFFAEIHQQVARYNLKPVSYVLYRFFSSILSFFVISLIYSLVTLAFQVDFTVAFGKSGFLVYWMLSFLTIWAVGMANEIVALLLIVYYPPLIGFWMIFWVVVNISPTFTPLALCAEFYRYGYALPTHNSYEATKVIFFNTYKGQLGRNFGILVAWIVILCCIFPFVIKFFGKSMAKKAQKAAEKAQQEKH